MKVSIKRKEFLTMLEFAKRFIEKKGTFPILKNVRLEVTKEGLRLRTTDMYNDFSALIEDVRVFEEGATTVSVDQLYNLLKRDNGYTIDMIVEDNDLIVEGRSISSVICGIPAKEYVADIQRPGWTIHCSSSLLLDAIDKVSFAVTPKSFSPILTGVLIKQVGDQVHFVGTDSFRLVRYKAQADLGEFECVVPVDALKLIAPILKHTINVGVMDVMIGKNEENFSISILGAGWNIVVTSLLVKGNYPDYDREEVVPTSYQGYLILDRAGLMQGLSQIVGRTKGQMSLTKFSLKDLYFSLSSGKTDNGELDIYLPHIHFGALCDFSLNGKFLLDFLKKCKSTQIRFDVIDNKSPIKITGVNDYSIEYIVRPLVK